ncbi:MAG: NAD-dependent epimerase/dehydratase family protein [Methanoregulaceae archaeon]|nr:NAD-dependent epimerase/dehydratase family protein [Methanoregulaceae archaeon]
MNLLILGGTSFVGRHIVTQALERGHVVTLAHRGQTNNDIFPECEHLHFDRLGEWPDLGDRRWDAVVDTSAYVPRAITTAAEHLASRADQYLFISTISVYDLEVPGAIDESSALYKELDEPTEEVNAQTYGPLKVACERVAKEAWGDQLYIVRPGIVIGQWDPTNRFEHWVRLIHAGGEVKVPQRLDQPVQAIDGADLARFTLDILAGPSGVWNANGDETTFGTMLDTIRVTLSGDAQWVPVPIDELEKSPMVLPDDGSRDAIFRCSNARARAAGLKLRTLSDTVVDIVYP